MLGECICRVCLVHQFGYKMAALCCPFWLSIGCNLAPNLACKYSRLIQDFISGNVILSIIMPWSVLTHSWLYLCGISSRYNVCSRSIFRYTCFCVVALDIINYSVIMSTRDSKISWQCTSVANTLFNGS